MSKTRQEAAKEIIGALERAAHSAVFGSREARSGRFDVTFTEEKRIAATILRESQAAYQAWSNWEAINDQFADKISREAIQHLELGAIGTVRTALGSNAILHAYTLTDVYSSNANDDRLTLCRFAFLFDDPKAVELLSSEQWARDLGHPQFVISDAATKNGERIERFRSLIVPNWSKAQAPDSALERLRQTLRPVRNRLAHAVAAESFDDPTIDQIRQFMKLTLELSTDMAFLLLGSAVSAQSFEEFSSNQAKKFWSFAFQAPIDAYNADMKRRRDASID